MLMPTKIWVDFRAQGKGPLRADLFDRLARERFEASLLDSEEPSGPGLVVFDRLDSTVCDHVRLLSRNGLGRVLAVAIASEPLPDGAAWSLLKMGASDVVTWNGGADTGAAVCARLRRWASVDDLVRSPVVVGNLVGCSPAWTIALRQVVEVALFTDAAVMITGESGTGKELVARLIHTLDRRPNKGDLVILDCTTIVPELAGSEFFGHERGAFTNAVAARDGAFALAHGGTLFLDEVGELPLMLQADLLRVVQERTYKRVGSNTWERTDFRLVCATNRDLLQEEAQGRFRRDFYYRIAGCACKLPALRERTEDILPLTRHFLAQFRPDLGTVELDESVRQYLLRRAYPGNVRDLRQLISRVACRHVGPSPITVGDIPEDERPDPPDRPDDWCDETFERTIRRALAWGVGLKDIGRVAEDVAVRNAVAAEDGNLQRAARRLGVTDRALQLRRASRRQQDGEANGRHGS
jgi:transcriptional regulator with GAF, ATPase, and Fis domain